ncbi:hypothetical protein JNB88_27525 [Rhizobium cauense]|uniref:hypothetical protein n=1 Tax=Rhizobium cauense TaxID=1166683 RepID=UPI001C6E4598|nr:hypothetical protein [Rhizobium cauense]MBW9117375.1 hypothetical protein [Rhizobium cauense]
MSVKQSPLPEGVEDHGPFQRRMWFAQRIAWAIFAVILVACLLGAFGRGGFLSRASIQSRGGQIDYPFITRWNAPDDLKLTFASSSGDHIFFVDSRFFDALSVERIEPPQKVTLVRDGLTGYVFPGGQSKPTRVTLRLQTQKPGLQRMTFGFEGEVVERSILVLP